MILADENIHGFIVRELKDAGFQVALVVEISSGIKDEQVIDLAVRNNYLLLTEDKDFGEWVFAHHVKGLSVLFLRYHFSEYREIAHALVGLLRSYEFQRPFFATITKDKIRVRNL